jgi:hypothetical protein
MQATLSTDVELKRSLLRDCEDSLRVCMAMDPADPRSYVVLGKLLMQQKRYDEARKLYADGTTASGAWCGEGGGLRVYLLGVCRGVGNCVYMGVQQRWRQ